VSASFNISATATKIKSGGRFSTGCLDMLSDIIDSVQAGVSDDHCASTATSVPTSRDQCEYAANYCEENVYKLVRRLIAAGRNAAALHAVFITNPSRTVPFWQQRAGAGRPDHLVVWDYHVLCIEAGPSNTPLVWDLDTRLPFPCDACVYAREALGVGFVPALPEELQR